jgi:hypothetical protein
MYKSIAVPLVVAILCVGHLQAGPFTLSKIADENTAIPGGNTNFMGFGLPSIDGSNVAFIGVSPLSEHGIYMSSGGTITKIVDGNTPVPDGVSNFSSYGSYVSLSGSNVAFWGQHPGPLQGSIQGVYAQIGGSLQVIADGNTPIPSGGQFAGFGSLTPSIDGATVAFVGVSSQSDYSVCVSVGGAMTLAVDSNTPVPGGVGNFTPGFFEFLAMDSGNLAFGGIDAATGKRGIYLSTGSSLTKIVDENTPMPGGAGPFTAFVPSRLHGDTLIFQGEGSGGGIFQSNAGGLTKLFDQNAPIPDGIGNFLNIGSVASDGSHVAFRGIGPAGQDGIYTNIGGAFTKLIDLNDTIDGRSVQYFTIGPESLSGNSIAFIARFADDNTEGLYVATLVPEPSTLILAALGLIGFAAWGWRRKRR